MINDKYNKVSSDELFQKLKQVRALADKGAEPGKPVKNYMSETVEKKTTVNKQEYTSAKGARTPNKSSLNIKF